MSSVDRERFEATFQKIRLETSVGHHVQDAWVMPFVLPAEVVMFGSRVFVLTDRTLAEADGVLLLLYREGLMTFTVDPVNGNIVL